MSATPEPTASPLVAELHALMEETGKRELFARDASKRLEEARTAEKAKKQELLALGVGRYTDGTHVATVVAGVEPTLSPDTYELGSKEDEEQARALAGDQFGRLFEAHTYYTPREGFLGYVKALITSRAKRAKLLELCLRPGQPAGGRVAGLRWAR